MDFIWNMITDWLKDLMIDGIKGNLQGLFDNVNQQVGEIAGQVTHVFSPISEGVIYLSAQQITF